MNGAAPPEVGTPPAEPSRLVGPAGEPVAMPAAPRGRPRVFTRRVLLPVLLIVVLAVGFFAFNAFRESELYVSTENAQLSGQPVQVGAMNAGRVDAIMPNIGDAVHKSSRRALPQSRTSSCTAHRGR